MFRFISRRTQRAADRPPATDEDLPSLVDPAGLDDAEPDRFTSKLEELIEEQERDGE